MPLLQSIIKMDWSEFKTVVCGFETYSCWYMTDRNRFDNPRTKTFVQTQKVLKRATKKYKTYRGVKHNLWLRFTPLIFIEILLPCFTMILASFIKKFSWNSLIRSWQDLIKMYQEFLSYEDLGKIIHVLSRLSRSCMSWQGVSSFVSLGNGKLYKKHD